MLFDQSQHDSEHVRLGASSRWCRAASCSVIAAIRGNVGILARRPDLGM
jgi:hypothetical protein